MDPRSQNQLVAECRQAAARGDFETAETGYRKLLQLQPGHRDASLGLADLAFLAQEPAAAEAILTAAARRHRKDPLLRAALARALHLCGRGAEALSLLDALAKEEPRTPEHQINRGHVLRALGRQPEAGAAFERALEIRPDQPDLLWALALIRQSTGRRVQAVRALDKLLDLVPAHRNAIGLRLDLLRQIGRVEDGLVAADAGLKHHPTDAALLSQRLLLAQYDDRQTPADLLAAAREWGRLVSPPRAELPAARPLADRRLRVGYYAADWAERAIHVFTRHLVGNHDRTHVEVFVYQDGPRADALTGQLRSRAEHWRETWRLDEAAAAARIAEDDLDVLIDVNGHMSNPRPGLLARKPARHMAHYLDFPGTTGIGTMDARIADEITEPAAEEGRWSTEQILRLGKSLLVYRGPTDSAEPNELPALASGRITFGSVNTLPKLNPATLRLWAAVLAAVPDSRLLVAREELAEPELAREWREKLALHGLPPERVEFLTSANFRRLESYHPIDIALDSTPYNGVTTTGDALWMGVPVISLRGDRFGGRISASILTAAGHPEWIAASEADYVRIARDLSADLPALARTRAKLRPEMLASPLADVQGLLHDFEALLFSWVEESEPTAGQSPGA